MVSARSAAATRWLIAIALAVAGCSGGEEVTQPFPFNHEVHIKGEVDCLQCHSGVLDPSEHRVPPLDVCTDCHFDEPPADNKNLIRLAKLVEEGAELDWDPTLRLPDHVFFPHVRHVEVAEYECVKCHGDMPSRSKPPPRRRFVSMDECIECHADNVERPSARRAVTDCGSCHR